MGSNTALGGDRVEAARRPLSGPSAPGSVCVTPPPGRKTLTLSKGDTDRLRDELMQKLEGFGDAEPPADLSWKLALAELPEDDETAATLAACTTPVEAVLALRRLLADSRREQNATGEELRRQHEDLAASQTSLDEAELEHEASLAQLRTELAAAREEARRGQAAVVATEAARSQREREETVERLRQQHAAELAAIRAEHGESRKVYESRVTELQRQLTETREKAERDEARAREEMLETLRQQNDKVEAVQTDFKDLQQAYESRLADLQQQLANAREQAQRDQAALVAAETAREARGAEEALEKLRQQQIQEIAAIREEKEESRRFYEARLAELHAAFEAARIAHDQSGGEATARTAELEARVLDLQREVGEARDKIDRAQEQAQAQLRTAHEAQISRMKKEQAAAATTMAETHRSQMAAIEKARDASLEMLRAANAQLRAVLADEQQRFENEKAALEARIR
jgi:hypothetical protein